ncbi:MAG TPA: PAS domain S-box protein [Chitinophagaceae bacterium]
MFGLKHKILRSGKKLSAGPVPSQASSVAVQNPEQSTNPSWLSFENIPFPSCVIDLDTLQFLEVNKVALEFYGYSEEELRQMNLTQITAAEEIVLLEEDARRSRENKHLLQHTWTHYKKNRDRVNVEIKGSNFFYHGKRARILLVNDVTSRIKTEANLKRINEQYRLANERYNIIANATHDLIWDWNLQTNELYRDPKGLVEVYGIRNSDPIRHINHWLERIHPDDLPNVQKTILNIVNAVEQHIFDIEYRFKREDGDYAFIYDRAYILRDEDGKAYRVIGAAQNITERKKLELEILNQQKVINQATIDTQEKERMEISKELHDNVNQLLTTTKLYLDLASTNPELKDELIQKSSKNIISAISEIRTLSQSLMAPSLGDLGLVDSVEDLVQNINITRKINAVFIHEEINETHLDENHKLTLFRIIQEALNNIVKHAEASSAIIELSSENDATGLAIKDNGKGFDLSTIKKGSGLNNIRNRVYLLNGTVTIDTQPGKGCTLVVGLPHH